MDIVEEWLLEYEIVLIRQPGIGFIADGREINLRNAIEGILVDTLGEISLLALYQGEHNSFISRFDIGATSILPLSLANDSLSLRFCGRLVEYIEQMQDFFFTDSSHISLALFLFILINRNLDGYKIDHYSKGFEILTKTREYSIAERIVNKINLRFDLNLPENEIIYISIRIMGVKQRQSFSINSQDFDIKISDDELEEATFELVNTPQVCFIQFYALTRG